MKQDGYDIDTKAIADGLYQIITEQGDEAIVAFGMLPAPIMRMAEDMIRSKVIEIAAQQQGVTIEEIKPHIDKQVVDRLVSKAMKEISVGILNAASRAKKLLV